MPHSSKYLRLPNQALHVHPIYSRGNNLQRGSLASPQLTRRQYRLHIAFDHASPLRPKDLFKLLGRTPIDAIPPTRVCKTPGVHYRYGGRHSNRSLSEYLNTTYRPDCDYVDGELRERNVGKWQHARIQFLLTAWFAQHEFIWNAIGRTELRMRVFPTRTRIADLASVRPGPQPDVLVEPPLLVIEILSPDDTYSELQERSRDYQSMGVETIWIIDPKTRTGRMCLGPNGSPPSGSNFPAPPSTSIFPPCFASSIPPRTPSRHSTSRSPTICSRMKLVAPDFVCVPATMPTTCRDCT